MGYIYWSILKTVPKDLGLAVTRLLPKQQSMGSIFPDVMDEVRFISKAFDHRATTAPRVRTTYGSYFHHDHYLKVTKAGVNCVYDFVCFSLVEPFCHVVKVWPPTHKQRKEKARTNNSTQLRTRKPSYRKRHYLFGHVVVMKSLGRRKRFIRFWGSRY